MLGMIQLVSASVSVLATNLSVPTVLEIYNTENGKTYFRGGIAVRYANRDYIFVSQRRHICERLKILFSYDIACQYCKKFSPRMLCLPSFLRFTVNPSLFIFAIPKLHIHGHRPACQAQYSLKYLFGSGQTDGEGIECTWAMMGPVATSTKEMGPGHRHDTLDDHWGYWNWLKLIRLGKSFVNTSTSLDILTGPLLKRHLGNAIAELAKQEEAFNSFSLNQAEQVPEWKAAVEQFENDPKANSPFIRQSTGVHAYI